MGSFLSDTYANAFPPERGHFMAFVFKDDDAATLDKVAKNQIVAMNKFQVRPPYILL